MTIAPFGLVVLEADAAGLGEVEGAGLGRAVRVGLAEAALGAAQARQVALDGADVRRGAACRQGGEGGQRGEGEEEGAAVHGARYRAEPAPDARARCSQLRQRRQLRSRSSVTPLCAAQWAQQK